LFIKFGETRLRKFILFLVEEVFYLIDLFVKMSKHSITVIGSTNTDMVIKTTRLPLPGETILGGDFLMNPGGKGANQAVAAARLNGKVTLVAKTGGDIFGREAKKLFLAENLNTEFLFSDPEAPSGIALITVNEQGENCIVVAPGANARLVREDTLRIRKFQGRQTGRYDRNFRRRSPRSPGSHY